MEYFPCGGRVRCSRLDDYAGDFGDDIRDSPEFQKRLALNETLRAGYRKETEAQLANPKPNWVKAE